MHSKSTTTVCNEDNVDESMEEFVFEQICDTIFVLIPEGMSIFQVSHVHEKHKILHYYTSHNVIFKRKTWQKIQNINEYSDLTRIDFLSKIFQRFRNFRINNPWQTNLDISSRPIIDNSELITDNKLFINDE